MLGSCRANVSCQINFVSPNCECRMGTLTVMVEAMLDPTRNACCSITYLENLRMGLLGLLGPLVSPIAKIGKASQLRRNVFFILFFIF